MGSLYQRRFASGELGATWWIKYYVGGKPVRESTGTTDEQEAKRILKTKEGKAVSGEPVLPRVDRIKYDEIAADLRGHYETTGERNLEEADARLAHLARYFAGRKVAAVGPNDFTRYTLGRQKQGAANGTINRELGVLGRMLRLAYENGKLMRLPIIRQLKEADPRAGFFEAHQFEAVRRRLPEDLRLAVTIAYTFGWRIKSEVLSLTLAQVNLEAGTLRLDPGQTKNEDGRLVYLTPELTAMLRAQEERVKGLMRARGAVIPFLFPHLSGRFVGRPRRDFVRRWRTACRNAGCPGMLRHDFRRTAVRNMVNLGVPERVAMTVTGHRTRAVFDRYHIVSPADLQAVARRLAGVDHAAHSRLDVGIGTQ
ncbi:MAG: site-specific integrase [Candidatus Methylomirabilota bacterium]|jgi:integrase